jgi:hypothetical protein
MRKANMSKVKWFLFVVAAMLQFANIAWAQDPAAQRKEINPQGIVGGHGEVAPPNPGTPIVVPPDPAIQAIDVSLDWWGDRWCRIYCPEPRD